VRAAEWRLLEFPVKENVTKAGANKLDVKVTRGSEWHGWLWDAILMDTV
jgi:rhamnogalacturonan endolyase